MIKEDEKEDKIFELTDSDYILNLDYYLHSAIMDWLKALPSTLKAGQDLDVALTVKSLAAEDMARFAKSKKLIHVEEKKLTDETGKAKDKILENNKKAKEYQEKFNQYKKDLETRGLAKNVRNAKLSSFPVDFILDAIQDQSTKRGKVIV